MVLYWLVKFLSNIFFRVYYKIEYADFHKVPKGKPLILAPNHVNAFIDPITVGTYPKMQKVRFFARGDIFKGKFARFILNDLNISPMYRIQEGYGEIKKNDKTFQECYRLLKSDKTLVIHPEATCVQVRRVRPLKKGLSRVAFQAAESFDWHKDIMVQPVGLNYSSPRKFRSSIYVEFGEPISLKRYEEEYKKDKVRAINDFTKVLERGMADHLVMVMDHANERLVEEIEEIALSQWMTEQGKEVNSLRARYQESRVIAEMVNQLAEQQSEVLNDLKNRLAQYLRRVKGNGLRDHLLRPDVIDKMNFLKFLGEYVIIAFGLPIYGIAWLLNNPPYHLGKMYSDKKIKSHEFYASVRANISMIFWILYYGLQLLTVALVFRSWPLLGIYAVTVPVLGIFGLHFYPRMKKIFGRWNLLRMVRKERTTVQELVDERARIIQQLNELMNRFVGA